MSLLRRPLRGRPAESGQVLILLVFFLIAMLSLAALLFDAANGLVYRRALQNAADAAAMAGANVIQAGGAKGCNAAGGSSPRALVRDAATSSAAQNATGYAVDSIEVTCPSGYADTAVRVTISGRSPGFFGGILGYGQSGPDADRFSNGFGVSASGTAMNGGAPGTNFSVVLLNPHNPTWTAKGCPSFLLAGGPTVIFDGNVQVNSACPAGSGGAMGTNGNAASLTFNNNSFVRLVGGFSPGPLAVTPYPQTGAAPLRDPLLGLPSVPVASLPVRSEAQISLNSGLTVLEPGIYRGGIRLVSSASVLLRPGIFVIDGGGIDAGAQSSIITIGSTITTSSITSWEQDCPAGSCGVLIYNTGITRALGQVQISAGATVLLRAYNPAADLNGSNVEEYKNLIIWQDGNPVPRSNYSQPQLRLGGGGSAKITGTVYAPSAPVYMTGGSGGSGGDTNLTLQFIVWDLEIRGNSTFHFVFNSDAFARPIQYGLVE
jgi:hypothetical protein